MQSKILLALCLALPCFYAQAQENIGTLHEVIVTASRIPMASYKTGRSVELITAQQLRALPVSTLDELLRYVVGVNVNMRGPFGVQNDIGMRGSTFSQVLVLIDNVRFNDPLTAHFNNNIPVALSEVQQVEIVRGPAAASYGSDAVGGLIHVKTKTYMARELADTLDLAGELAIGQHRLQSSDVGLVLQKQRWLFSTSFKSNRSDGEQHVNPNFLAGNAPDSLYNNFFDIRTYSASVGFIASDALKLHARVSSDYRDFSAKYFYTRSPFDESVETIKNLWTQLAVQYDRGKHSMELNAGYKVTDDVFDFNPAFAPNVHQTTQTFLNFGDRYALDERWELAYGAQYLHKGIVSTDRGDHENYSFGIYAMASRQLGERWQANGSLRLEQDSNFGTELLPQASLSYRGEGYVLRTSYGRSIRAADFTERFVSFQLPNLAPGRNIGNPDLRAELSNSWDLGGEWFLPGQLTLSATGFLRQSQNLIDFSLRNSNEIDNLDNLLPNENYFYADNIAESQTYGIELSVRKHWAYGDAGSLQLQAGYAWLETTAPADILSKYISNHPRHNASANIVARVGWFSLSSSANFIVRQGERAELIAAQVPSQYLVTNLRGTVHLGPKVSFFGQVFNLGNVSYQEVLGARLPGRWFSMGVSWQ